MQEPSGLRLAVQVVPEMAKSPVVEGEMLVRAVCCLLVRVKVNAALVVPTATVPNE